MIWEEDIQITSWFSNNHKECKGKWIMSEVTGNYMPISMHSLAWTENKISYIFSNFFFIVTSSQILFTNIFSDYLMSPERTHKIQFPFKKYMWIEWWNNPFSTFDQVSNSFWIISSIFIQKYRQNENYHAF
jgi:hypothetical protein